MHFSKLAPVAVVLAALSGVEAGPIAYGLCQTGCNAVAVACYAAAGFTFGTVIAAPAAPAAILACNAALGACSATCATIGLFAPTP
ncbi:hypothetical protein BDN71DRAFT_1386764 [Pleurotus eryngii]|uniref:Uncharacterized protein n=1 Tax=Pleurotus eryngii TaxID=5323 RepID=A0A9P6DHW1_PLEER|nr:hypothetical protein BDN71DRAFT_1386764 [Pleurotus eryngii]